MITVAEQWQQGVSYDLTGELDVTENIIHGTEQLVYTNNSPDTLAAIYFHLYQNAYKKGSYYDLKQRSQGNYRIKHLSPQEEGGTDILDFTIDGKPSSYSIDNTIMQVLLPELLFPGSSIVFNFRFLTKYGSINRRMKHDGKTYVVAHWYPRIVVYDSHRGWNVDQHLGNEFYGDFGHFHLEVTAPDNYIVGATGTLLNRETVLPDSLRSKLDIRNFSNKPWDEASSEIIKSGGGTKTWIYSADNVHDVAWIASPDFRIGTAEWNGVKVYSYAREQHASGWQDAAEFGARIIRNYSRKWGKYAYPKMIIADVSSGMEYPMLVAVGGRRPNYCGLFAHEIAHNWFYGMLGSNETYRAFLDEGFANFITAEGMLDLYGPNNGVVWDSTGTWYQRQFYPRYSRKYIRNDLRYMQWAKTGYLTHPLATHSDQFNERNEYRQAYYKGATMLYNLQYVLGDSLFQEAMRRYVAMWKFRHPYPDDFVAVIEQTAGIDLTWFFDEWLNETSNLDYGIKRIKNHRNDDRSYTAIIDLARNDFMRMPLDLEIKKSNGSIQTVIIPVNDKFVKSDRNAFIAKPWFGWGKINSKYGLSLKTNSPVTKVRIDPSGRLADVNRLDNVSGIGIPVAWHFDNMKYIMPTLDRYDVWLRPSFLYNSVDGLKPGIHWYSSYLFSRYLNWWQIKAGVWYGPLSQKVGYEFKFETPVQSLGRLTNVYVNSMVQEGREWHSVGIFGQSRKRLDLRPAFDYMAIKLTQYR